MDDRSQRCWGGAGVGKGAGSDQLADRRDQRRSQTDGYFSIPDDEQSWGLCTGSDAGSKGSAAAFSCPGESAIVLDENFLDGMDIAEEHLKEMDGRKFPLRLVPGGPVIAEGMLTYHEEEGELRVS